MAKAGINESVGRYIVVCKVRDVSGVGGGSNDESEGTHNKRGDSSTKVMAWLPKI